MNGRQKIVLIGAGVLVALVQLYGIVEYGLDDNRGWPIAFLISAILLFVGLGNWEFLPSLMGRLISRDERGTSEKAAPVPTTPRNKTVPASLPTTPARSGKYKYGIHISELDIAVETNKELAALTDIYHPEKGNGRSLNWNITASVYASIRLVVVKSKMTINRTVWNTIVRAAIIRMTTEEDPNIGMGSPGYNELEEAAYKDLTAIDAAVNASIQGKGAFMMEPLSLQVSAMFGAEGEQQKAVSGMLGMTADTAQKKILPELLEDLT